jgi:hypothetical protein
LAIADRDGVRLLWRLHAMGFVRFYDDGMTAISSRTVLYQSAFLPQGVPVDSWNYHWLSPSRAARLADLSCAHRALVRACLDIDLFSIGHVKPLEYESEAKSMPVDESGIINIILASNWIDHDVLSAELHRSEVEIADAVYIPHYNVNKNSELFLSTCIVQRCYLPELFLARLFEVQRCRLFFGVTSTSVYFCELLHGGELLPFEPVFVGSRRLAY